MERLIGRVAIVTGAASGQGAAEAKLFAKEGAKVVATDVQIDLLNKVVEEINEAGGEAIAIQQDVSNEEKWKEVVDTTVEKFGKLDILVNNAGIYNARGMKTIEDLTTEDWNLYMDVNAKSAFYGIKYGSEAMKKAGKGSIINISSMNGIFAGNGVGANYSASKAGVRMMTKVAAFELGKYNIRSNSIHPGFIKTPMSQQATADKELYEHLVSRIPLGVGGDPEDVAYLALFLASDESKFITGQEFIIDGGQTSRV